MGYRNLRECVLDLEAHGHLIRIPQAVDPRLEMAEIQRRVYATGGPAVFYEQVKGSPFPAVSNLFGTVERSRFIFRDTLDTVKKIMRLKGDPGSFFRAPLSFLGVPPALARALPRKVSQAAILENETTISQLPHIQSWPDDGGAFILLPQVYTEDLDAPGTGKSNLGMYRVQMSGNEYEKNRSIGLHYQIRRDIGIHHSKALRDGVPLRVSIFVGGPPAHSFAAVMYLPEGMPEISFAGVLGGRPFRYTVRDGFVISADADFCITGWVDPQKTLPEGPFGDHLGYYSLRHDFPFMKVEKVYHRKDAIWPFTVVGRPPQEDTSFGALIQEIAGPVLSKEIPGVKAVHAVDAAGVHPLLLAVGSERYMPYREREPQEILKQSNALLGYGPLSLAKYLLIAAGEDDTALNPHNIPAFLHHFLERADWRRDLHFQTRTTIDTLDYSGSGLNAGSKAVMAAAGKKIRALTQSLPEDFSLAEGFSKPRFVLPGVLIVQAPAASRAEFPGARVEIFARHLENVQGLEAIPWIVLADDSEFSARTLNNFLWVTFTRSDPAQDIYGVRASVTQKHWGCLGPLIIDARVKPQHAPPLLEDPAITRRVDALGAAGGPLHGII